MELSHLKLVRFPVERETFWKRIIFHFGEFLYRRRSARGPDSHRGSANPNLASCIFTNIASLWVTRVVCVQIELSRTILLQFEQTWCGLWSWAPLLHPENDTSVVGQRSVGPHVTVHWSNCFVNHNQNVHVSVDWSCETEETAQYGI